MDPTQSPDTAHRLANAEAELARVKLERDLYKASTNELMRGSFADVPLTLEEQDELMNAPEGEPIERILEQFELRHPEFA